MPSAWTGLKRGALQAVLDERDGRSVVRVLAGRDDRDSSTSKSRSEMVQDAVAIMTDTQRGAVEVDVLPVLPDTIGDDLRRARNSATQAAILQEKVSAATRKVVVELREGERLSVRDVGKLLELSPQRVSQLAAYTAAKADAAQLKNDCKAKRSRRISK